MKIHYVTEGDTKRATNLSVNRSKNVTKEPHSMLNSKH